MNERWRCEQYLRWVASLPCSACSSEEGVQAHHFKGTGKLSGAALKAPDDWAMPLCADCHRALHTTWTRPQMARQWEWVARTRAQFWQLMVSGLGESTMDTLVRGVARGDVIGGRPR